MTRENLRHIVTTGKICEKSDRGRQREEFWQSFAVVWKGVSIWIETCVWRLQHASWQTPDDGDDDLLCIVC